MQLLIIFNIFEKITKFLLIFLKTDRKFEKMGKKDIKLDSYNIMRVYMR